MFFFFNDTATTEIYTLSLHDALPISRSPKVRGGGCGVSARRREFLRRLVRRRSTAPVMIGEDPEGGEPPVRKAVRTDRKSTRLNSSHANISYAVFCLKKKKKHKI